jgi:hypothetical protein
LHSSISIIIMLSRKLMAYANEKSCTYSILLPPVQTFTLQNKDNAFAMYHDFPPHLFL